MAEHITRNDDALKKWIESGNDPFCFLVAGETGAGKSSLINKLLQKKVAEVQEGPFSVNLPEGVAAYEENIPTPHGVVKVKAIDSMGVADTDKGADEICEIIAKKSSKIHLFVYCLNISARFRSVDQQMIWALTTKFGCDMWKHSIIAFTFADRVTNPLTYEAFKAPVNSTLKATGVKELEDYQFCLVAADINFVPPGLPCGQDQDQDEAWNWRLEFLASAFRAAPSCVSGKLLKLHESTLKQLYRKHSSVIKTVGVAAFVGAAMMLPLPPIASVSPQNAKTVVTVASSTLPAMAFGLKSYFSKTLKEKYEEYMKEYMKEKKKEQ